MVDRRLREMISLYQANTEVTQHLQFVGGLDAFCDDSDPDRIAYLREGLDDRLLHEIVFNVVDQDHIYLDDVRPGKGQQVQS